MVQPIAQGRNNPRSYLGTAAQLDVIFRERSGRFQLLLGGAQLQQRGFDAFLAQHTGEQTGGARLGIVAGGGVSSAYDPLESLQFTLDEMRASVDAARDWGTYVCAHVYTSPGIRRCIEAGVMSIEHGQLADEDTVRLIADKGVWWSIQPFLMDEDSNTHTAPKAVAAQKAVSEGTVRAFALAEKHKANWAFGTDILYGGGESQGRQLRKLTRFMSPLTALHRATGAAGDMLALSGSRAPYDGKLGVISVGALADLLVIDGDTEANLDWLESTDNLRLIMKGGRIVKSTL